MKNLVLFLSLVSSLQGFCQQFIESIYTTDPYVQQLFELAFENNKEFETLENTIVIAKTESAQATWEWMNSIRAVGNINEYVINPERNQNNILFPRYNFSLTIPLGIFADQATNKKIAKEKADFAENMAELRKNQIKQEIVIAYNDFIKTKELLERQRELTENEYSNYLILEEKFKNNDIDLQELNQAQRTYNREFSSQVSLLSDFNRIKLQLETKIGAPLPPLPEN
ncbi:MAG: TolC family protein [Cyclobacteriaceae bacterium]